MKTRHFDRIGDCGVTLTEIGFGTAPMANLYRPVDVQDARSILELAGEKGFRYFDIAPLYCLSLTENRLKGFFRGKPRDVIVVSTKVGQLLDECGVEDRAGIRKWFDGPCRREFYVYSYDGVMRSVETSLERMGLDRIAILYGHDIDTYTDGLQDSMEQHLRAVLGGGHKALVELREQWVTAGFEARTEGMVTCRMAGRSWRPGHHPSCRALHPARARGVDALPSQMCRTRRRDCHQPPLQLGHLATGPREGGALQSRSRAGLDPRPGALDRPGVSAPWCAPRQRCVSVSGVPPAVFSEIPGRKALTKMTSNLEPANAVMPTALWADLMSDGLLLTNAPTP
ncbi:aldo/keto reductase [Ruegeria arenilitoris]|uniref:aldo/keto reductase n=1 Tax=Ruegeria arenilitoris TaxID=1173585 RepID=UPI0020C41E34|nr:aldo/keto reductase [Ruegeria arenilitoris]